jgi:hypothetical protein
VEESEMSWSLPSYRQMEGWKDGQVVRWIGRKIEIKKSHIYIYILVHIKVDIQELGCWGMDWI